jgi:O-antigen ligase
MAYVSSHNPLFGLGPTFHIALEHNGQVHSLPVQVFAHYGVLGVLLIFGVFIQLVGGFFTIYRKNDREMIPFVSAAIFYLAFFSFSARGLEIESFAILSLAVASVNKR